MAQKDSTGKASPISGADITALTETVYSQLDALRGQPKSADNLNAILRLLAKWRSNIVANTIQKADGRTVQSGPFKGMEYLATGAEGSTAARLLGVYEAALHPVIEKIVQRGYDQVIDVGCAEGYYAVGLAMRMPKARILAHDSNEKARQKCAELAALNGVSAQIDIGGALAHAGFDVAGHANTLIVCDIEGACKDLLDPLRAKGLLHADILVEVHDCFHPGLSTQMAARFATSHDVQIIHRGVPIGPLPAWMNNISDLDRLIALWEWRIGPTPWLWMTRKHELGEQHELGEKE